MRSNGVTYYVPRGQQKLDTDVEYAWQQKPDVPRYALPHEGLIRLQQEPQSEFTDVAKRAKTQATTTTHFFVMK